MPKFRSHLDTPSSKALQLYLDDLIMPDNELLPQSFSAEDVEQTSYKKQTLIDEEKSKRIADNSLNDLVDRSKYSNTSLNTIAGTNINEPDSARGDNSAQDGHEKAKWTNYVDPIKPTICEDKLNNAKELIEKANAISDLLLTQPKRVNAEQVQELTDGLLQKADPINESEHQSKCDYSKEIQQHADNNTKRQIRSEHLSLYESLPSRFQVLLCDIGSQTLAIPLVELGGIMQVEHFTQRSSKNSWFYGLYVKGEQTFTCINGSKYMSASNEASAKVNEEVANCEYKYLVQLGKSEFALCCHNVATTLEVEKQEVKWRQNITKQPWFAGILKEKMHALIDSTEMVKDVLKISGAT